MPLLSNTQSEYCVLKTKKRGIDSGQGLRKALLID